jgi:toxin ParE1/3/4
VRRYRLGRLAERDLAAILARSGAEFGAEGRRRYAALIARAVRDVAEDPARTGSRARHELAAGTRTYHLLHSRDRVDAGVGRVHRPRHVLVYREVGPELVEIGRILHERMDLPRHIPRGYKAG